MLHTWGHILNGLCDILKNDRKIRSDVFDQHDESFSAVKRKLGYPNRKTTLRCWVNEMKNNGELHKEQRRASCKYSIIPPISIKPPCIIISIAAILYFFITVHFSSILHSFCDQFHPGNLKSRFCSDML